MKYQIQSPKIMTTAVPVTAGRNRLTRQKKSKDALSIGSPVKSPIRPNEPASPQSVKVEIEPKKQANDVEKAQIVQTIAKLKEVHSGIMIAERSG